MSYLLRLNEYLPYKEDSTAFHHLHTWLSRQRYIPDTEDQAQEESALRLGCSADGDQIYCGGWAGLARVQGIAETRGKITPFSQEIAVLPRQIGQRSSRRVDLVGMYLHCMSHPVVAEHLKEPTLYIWDKQELIDCPDELKQDALVFLALGFIDKLHQLCLRHLRNQFIRITANLTGRVKGRIDLARQVRANLPRGRSDLMACDFTIYNNNCRENQILKTALERCGRLLSRYNILTPAVWSKIHYCRNELGNVKEVMVTPEIFHGIRYDGLFRSYREPHRLARILLNLLSPDPLSAGTNKPVKVPPFAISTFELFERYCEVLLRKLYSEQGSPRLWVGYQNRTLGKAGNTRLRPDFLLCSKTNPAHCWIIDAKNKPGWDIAVKSSGSEWRNDVPQLCRYSRYIHVLDELGYSAADYPKAAPRMMVIYPGEDWSHPFGADLFENPEPFQTAGIQNLCAVRIKVPMRDV